MDTCSYVSIADNNCSYNDFSGIALGTSCEYVTVINNTCEWNEEYGIYLSWSTYNVVDRNIASHNHLMGIFLQSSSDYNNITNNECNDNIHGTMYYWGIHLEASNFNRIQNNTVLGNNDGISMMDSDSNDILNNTVDSSTNYGIVLSWDYNNDNEIAGNHVQDSTDYGIIIVWGSGNRVWNNTLIDNNGAGAVYDVLHLQGYDGDSGNFWNTSGTPHGYGNNWSDLQAPDSDWDGIVDWSYNITGNKDFYPLTTPGTPIPEPAVLILIGLMATVFFVSNHIRKKKQ
jgi:parallel beta-helix repeat protein